MYLWNINFETFNPLESLPQLANIAEEFQYEVSYKNFGSQRQNWKYGLFKYTLEGEGIFRDADGEHRIPKGHGFLVNISNPDTAYYYPEDGTDPWRFVYITFKGQHAMAMLEEMVKKYGPVYKLNPDDAIIKRLFSFQNYEKGYCEVSAAEGAEIVMRVLLALCASRENKHKADPGNVLVRLAQQTLRDNMEKNLNVSELANKLKITREHLTRVFKETLNVTPHDYIIKQQMLLACHLLKATNMTNKEISGKLGYTTPAHFNRTFKNLLKMTPSQFREAGTLPLL